MSCNPATCLSRWGRGTSVWYTMRSLDDFSDITLRDEPLAPYTWLKIGGPAQYFIRPRNVEELAEVVRCCHREQRPIHVLGGGSNLLIRDEGVSGVVLQLSEESF